MRYFRTEKGELVNMLDHTIKMINSNPNVRIYIGTDSQNYSGVTKFVTCVVFRWEESKGAHYIYFPEKVERIRDSFTRLYEEGTRTMEVFSIFEEVPIKVEALEFDFNNMKKTISSQLVSTFEGWCTGIGQRAIFKNGEMLACKAADHICRA